MGSIRIWKAEQIALSAPKATNVPERGSSSPKSVHQDSFRVNEVEMNAKFVRPDTNVPSQTPPFRALRDTTKSRRDKFFAF